jgi:hypothetical protein
LIDKSFTYLFLSSGFSGIDFIHEVYQNQRIPGNYWI